MADIPMKTKDEKSLLTLLGRLSRFLTTLTSWAGALVLFINVLVVFASVIWRTRCIRPFIGQKRWRAR